MKKALVIILFIFSTLFGFVDSDLDGVDDTIDKCPYSKITDLVDRFGCKVKEIEFKEKAQIDFYMGYSKSYYEDLKEESFDSSLTISYKNYSLYLANSIYTSYNDSTIAFYYKNSINKNLYYKLGLGVYFSDDKNIKNSYFASIKFSYFIKDFDISLKYKRVFNKDIKDSNLYELCLGYGYESLYLYSKLSYENSLDTSISDTKLLSLGTNYYFDNGFYLSFEYSKAINNEPLKALSAGVGYSF